MEGWMVALLVFAALWTAGGVVLTTYVERSNRERSRIVAAVRREQIAALTEDDLAWLKSMEWQP